MLRLTGVAVCLLVLCTTLFAQSRADQIIQWVPSMESAAHEASNQGKKIFLYFSGSDWCKPCIRLREKEINTESFTQFARNNLILLQADFPRLRKNQLTREQVRQNETLAEKYNSEGIFPLIVILDADGKVVGKTGYHEESAEEFVHRIQRLLTN